MPHEDYKIAEAEETADSYRFLLCKNPEANCDHSVIDEHHREFVWGKQDNTMTVPQMLREAALILDQEDRPAPRRLWRLRGRELGFAMAD